MATTITFKGKSPIVCNTVLSSKRPVTSADDIIKSQERPVIEIYFPVNTDFNTMVSAYEDSDALSEISINTEVPVSETITREATVEEVNKNKLQRITEGVRSRTAELSANVSIKRNRRDELDQQLINATANTSRLEYEYNTALDNVNATKARYEQSKETLKNHQLAIEQIQEELSQHQAAYDAYMADENIDHDHDNEKTERESRIAYYTQRLTQLQSDLASMTATNNTNMEKAATAEIDYALNEKKMAYDSAKSEETFLTESKAQADTEYANAVAALENVEEEVTAEIEEDIRNNPIMITDVEERITHQIFVHINYIIKLGLQLTTVDKTEQWVMTLGQLSEADIALRQLAGVVAKKVNFLSFEEYQVALIEQSKKSLAEYLETHPLISNCYHNTWNKFNATESHRNLFVSHYFAHTIKVQAGMTDDKMSWNISGQECVPWTDEEAALYTIAMDAYVVPLVHAQQRYELAIKAAKTKEELDAIVIDYDSVNAPNGTIDLLG